MMEAVSDIENVSSLEKVNGYDHKIHSLGHIHIPKMCFHSLTCVGISNEIRNRITAHGWEHRLKETVLWYGKRQSRKLTKHERGLVGQGITLTPRSSSPWRFGFEEHIS